MTISVVNTRSFYLVSIEGKEIPVGKSRGIGKGNLTQGEAVETAKRILAARDKQRAEATEKISQKGK